MDKPNRADRRKNKFGGGRSTEHGGWPTSEPNPVFGEVGTPAAPGGTAPPEASEATAGSEAPGEAITGQPDQDQTKAAGPGTGGATEQDGRMPRHEGVHGSNSAKG